jgi:shikimate dehydrogenase
MKRFALLGTGIDHSLSPRLHRAGFAAVGTMADYQLWETDAAQLTARLAQARQSLDGFNITAPLKTAVFTMVDRCSDRALRCCSVNTVRVVDGALHGDCTDIDGLDIGLRVLAPDPGEALVLGAGGVIGAVLEVLLAHQFLKITVVARSLHRTPRPGAAAQVEWQPWDRREQVAQRARLLIHATPIGAVSDAMALDLSAAHSKLAVFDLAYRRHRLTALVASAGRLGLRAIDGRIMLAEQAIAAQRFWGLGTGGAEAMRAAVRLNSAVR